MKFGFFDSGLGGLLMMQLCKEKYPEHNYVYVGDTVNLPYGPRDANEIEGFMSPYICWLLEKAHCDYVIIACNTASVKALEIFYLKFPSYRNKVIGITNPTISYLENLDGNRSLLLLATQGTVASKLYDIHINIDQVAMPGLVDLIESGKKSEALKMVIDALRYYPDITEVFLGCTHYVWLQKNLQDMFPDISFIGQDIILQELIESLAKNNKTPDDFLIQQPEYYVSGSSMEYSERYGIPFKKLLL